MRILLLADYYPPYLAGIHAGQDIGATGYVQEQDLMLADYYGAFGSYRNHFRRLGHQV